MKDEAFGYAYIAIVMVIIGYAVGRSHGEQVQRDQRRDSDLWSLKTQVSHLADLVKQREEAAA